MDANNPEFNKYIELFFKEGVDSIKQFEWSPAQIKGKNVISEACIRVFF